MEQVGLLKCQSTVWGGRGEAIFKEGPYCVWNLTYPRIAGVEAICKFHTQWGSSFSGTFYAHKTAAVQGRVGLPVENPDSLL